MYEPPDSPPSITVLEELLLDRLKEPPPLETEPPDSPPSITVLEVLLLDRLEEPPPSK